MKKYSRDGVNATDQFTFYPHLREYVSALRPDIEQALLRYLPTAKADTYKLFNEGLNYALFPGGKRLRPILTLLGAEVVGGHALDVLRAAVAVEYLHTSSLIFDDLPCMDNATERRNRSPLHVRHGEGVAILVALALMNASYGLILEGARSGDAHATNAHRELVECIGANGMIAGQFIDIATAASVVPNDGIHDGLNEAHNLKTSALMRLALTIGAILSGATQSQLVVLQRFANLIGDAFQISDDVLDFEDDATLSPPAARCPSSTSERGTTDAECRISSLVIEAKYILKAEFGAIYASRLLCEMADYISERKALRLESAGN